jgi:hypothetical protein
VSRQRIAWLPLLAVLASLFLLAGCGGKKGPKDNGVAKMSPSEALAQVKAAVNSATSVHIVGAGTSGGQPLALNLKLVKGKGGAGHITVNGLSFDIVRIGDTAYFKGSSRFWSKFGGSAAAQLFKGKWLMAPANKGELASFTPLTNLTALTNQVLASHGALKMGDTTEINGQPAVAIVDKSNGGTLYVATTGPAFPLKLTPGKGQGSINFSDWNQPVQLTKPAKPIDYSKLTGG